MPTLDIILARYAGKEMCAALKYLDSAYVLDLNSSADLVQIATVQNDVGFGGVVGEGILENVGI